MSTPLENHSYRLAVNLGIPIVVLTLGILAKKLTRNRPWERAHFYLGVELTLAAFAASLLNLAELFRPSLNMTPRLETLAQFNVVAVVLTTILLLLVLSLQQEWESQTLTRPKLSFFWLVFVSNVIGFGLLAFVVIIVPVS